MGKRILIGYTVINFLIFFIPVIFSFFIKLPESSNNTLICEKDKQANDNSLMLSVMDKENSEIKEYVLEEYLIGVVSAEMPALYETEALKAQAVAARSFIMSRQNVKNPDHPEAVVCNNPAHCKGYISSDEAKIKWGEEWGKFYPKIKNAVETTKGECISYENEVVEAFFFALSNGKTESSEEVWESSRPYLKSANSEYDYLSTDFNSTVEISLSDFNEKLKKLNSSYNVSEFVNMDNITYTKGGRVKNIDINSASFSGTEIRSAFGLNSADFVIKQQGEKIVFNVKGKGHGVGMSQYGANELAKKGYNYKDILKHYFYGVEIIYKE